MRYMRTNIYIQLRDSGDPRPPSPVRRNFPSSQTEAPQPPLFVTSEIRTADVR